MPVFDYIRYNHKWFWDETVNNLRVGPTIAFDSKKGFRRKD